MIRVLVTIWLLVLGAVPVAAQNNTSAQAPVDVLFRAMGMPDIIEIMRQEGLAYGAELRGELFPDRGGARWSEIVDEIYDLDRTRAVVRNRFDMELAAADLAPMLAFFTSERGQRIVRLEVTARRALLDTSVDEASRAALDAMIAAQDPRMDLLRDYAETNELVESNVVGAMNANFAFYTGLAAGGALDGMLSEEEILTDVWSQEAEIRDDTEDWLYSYLAMAYQPLEDEDILAYTRFSGTDAGQALNTALFVAFDEMFVSVSRALGQAASQFLTGEDI